jgi:hypothetical protein
MCICIRKEIENRKCWIILLCVDTHKRREKYLWNLNPLQISVKFLCRLPSWYNITSYFHFDYYHSFCVGFPFFKAIVSCRVNQRWEDICSFRAFPYKLQTSLQFFELVDDYIQSEINKPPMQTTCTVRISYEVISLVFMSVHLTLSHIEETYVLYSAFDLFVIFLIPWHKCRALYGYIWGDVEVVIFLFAWTVNSQWSCFYTCLSFLEFVVLSCINLWHNK